MKGIQEMSGMKHHYVILKGNYINSQLQNFNYQKGKHIEKSKRKRKEFIIAEMLVSQ